MRFILFFFGFLILAYPVTGFYLYKYQEDFVFPGSTKVLKSLVQKYSVPQFLTQISLPSEDGVPLVVWVSKTWDASKPSLFYFHGNAEYLPNISERFFKFKEMGFNLVLPAIRGYMDNFKPSEQALYQDAEAVFKNFEKKCSARFIIGYSLGSVPSAYLSFRFNSVDKLVLLAPFTSLEDMVRKHPFYRFFLPFLRLEMSVKRFLANTKTTQILIAHGLKDSVVPFEHFVDFKRLFGDKFLFFEYPDVGHDGIFEAAEEQIVKFLLNNSIPQESRREPVK